MGRGCVECVGAEAVACHASPRKRDSMLLCPNGLVRVRARACRTRVEARISDCAVFIHNISVSKENFDENAQSSEHDHSKRYYRFCSILRSKRGAWTSFEKDQCRKSTLFRRDFCRLRVRGDCVRRRGHIKGRLPGRPLLSAQCSSTNFCGRDSCVSTSHQKVTKVCCPQRPTIPPTSIALPSLPFTLTSIFGASLT